MSAKYLIDPVDMRTAGLTGLALKLNEVINWINGFVQREKRFIGSVEMMLELVNQYDPMLQSIMADIPEGPPCRVRVWSPEVQTEPSPFQELPTPRAVMLMRSALENDFAATGGYFDVQRPGKVAVRIDSLESLKSWCEQEIMPDPEQPVPPLVPLYRVQVYERDELRSEVLDLSLEGVVEHGKRLFHPVRVRSGWSIEVGGEGVPYVTLRTPFELDAWAQQEKRRAEKARSS